MKNSQILLVAQSAIIRATPEKKAAHTKAQNLQPSKPSAELKAAQDTAAYTLDLALLTAVLAGATVLSVIASIVIQLLVTKRDDKIRRDDSKRAEEARREQFAHAESIREANATEASQLRDLKLIALRSQMVEILTSFERYMGLLIASPQMDISAQIDTAQLLFARAFESDMGEALFVAHREPVYHAIIKAQETLNMARSQQQLREKILTGLHRDQREAAEYYHELEHAERTAALTNGLADIRRVEDLRRSPRGVDAKEYEDTKAARAARMDAIHPTIQQNAIDAKRVLGDARALLGDLTGPLPEPRPVTA